MQPARQNAIPLPSDSEHSTHDAGQLAAGGALLPWGLLGLLGYLLWIPAQWLSVAALPGREAEAAFLRTAFMPGGLFEVLGRAGLSGWLSADGPWSGLAWQLALRNVPLALVLASYAAGIVVVRRTAEHPALRRAILMWTGLYLLACIAIYPQTADVWFYLANARAWIVHGVNPYVTAVTDVVDPGTIATLNASANGSYSWFATYSYGPLWLMISGAVARAAGDSPWAGLLLLKLALIPFVAMGLWGVDRGLRVLAPERRALGWMLYAWNPLLLFVGVAGVHNDVAMAGLAAAGLALAMERRAVASLPTLALALLVKYASWSYAVAALVALLAARRITWRALAAGAILAIVIAVTLFAPFYAGPQALVAGVQSVLANQPGMTPVDWFTRQLTLRPEYAALGTGAYAAARAVVAPAGWALFGVLAGLALWTWRATPPAERAARLALALLLAFFYAATDLFRMWYGVWLVPLLALCAPYGRWWLAAVVFIIAALIAANLYLVYLLGGPNWRDWSTPLTYLPPLVPLLLSGLRGRLRRQSVPVEPATLPAR